MVKGKVKRSKAVSPRAITGTAPRCGRLDQIWIVRDPTGMSTIEDIVFAADPNRLAQVVLGTGLDRWVSENHVFYADEASARADAAHRLGARGM